MAAAQISGPAGKHPIDPEQTGWRGSHALPTFAYRCGHCGNQVASEKGYALGQYKDGSGPPVAAIHICPYCSMPTVRFPDGRLLPEVSFGSCVGHLPQELNLLYEEARRCTGTAAYTAAVLVCRKILMHIAVQQGAPEGETFAAYVTFLADNGYVPPNGRGWVDHIRKMGNEANHEIKLMSRDNAQHLILFIEMLLRFIYEFPNLVPAVSP